MTTYFTLMHNCPYNNNFKKFFNISFGNQGLLFDRFDRLTRIDNNIQYMADAPYTSILADFSHICQRRALKLTKLNKPILILSSTGLNSLTVIASFMLIGAHNKIRVVSLNSSELNLSIIKYLRSVNIQYDIIDDLSNIDFDKYIIVDGQCGNCVDKSISEFSIIKQKNINIIAYLSALKQDKSFKKWINSSSLTLNSDEKLLWYISFCFKWRLYAYLLTPRWLYMLTNKLINYNSYYAFFNTKGFSNYAITNFNKIISASDYKSEHKALINSAFQDKDIQNIVNQLEKTSSIHNWLVQIKSNNTKQYNDAISYLNSITLTRDNLEAPLTINFVK